MAARSHVMVHYRPGAAITSKAKSDIAAGTFVQYTGTWDDRRNPVIEPAAAGSAPVGFVRRDTPTGEYVAVDRGKFIADFAADSKVTAGAPVAIGAGGKVTAVTEGATVVGYAIGNPEGGYVAVDVK